MDDLTSYPSIASHPAYASISRDRRAAENTSRRGMRLVIAALAAIAIGVAAALLSA